MQRKALLEALLRELELPITSLHDYDYRYFQEAWKESGWAPWVSHIARASLDSPPERKDYQEKMKSCLPLYTYLGLNHIHTLSHAKALRYEGFKKANAQLKKDRQHSTSCLGEARDDQEELSKEKELSSEEESLAPREENLCEFVRSVFMAQTPEQIRAAEEILATKDVDLQELIDLNEYLARWQVGLYIPQALLSYARRTLYPEGFLESRRPSLETFQAPRRSHLLAKEPQRLPALQEVGSQRELPTASAQLPGSAEKNRPPYACSAQAKPSRRGSPSEAQVEARTSSSASPAGAQPSSPSMGFPLTLVSTLALLSLLPWYLAEEDLDDWAEPKEGLTPGAKQEALRVAEAKA